MTQETIEGKQVFWKKHTSKKGVEYEVGYLAEEDHQQASGDKKLTIESKGGRKSFWVDVDWGVDNDWENESSDFSSQTAITKHKVAVYSGIYDYILKIVNTAHYHYHFQDESGDWYGLNTFRNGSHYVRYNSPQPKIVSIKGA